MCRRYLQKYAWTYQNYVLTLPLCLASISIQSMDHLRELSHSNHQYVIHVQTSDHRLINAVYIINSGN